MIEQLQETIDSLWNDYFDLILLVQRGIKTYGKEEWDVESVMFGMIHIPKELDELGIKQSSENETYNLKRIYEDTKEYKDSLIQGSGI